MQKILLDASKSNKLKVVDNGSYLVMEGPQFSSLAESEIYKNW